jgi:2'-5' RNA ligase
VTETGTFRAFFAVPLAPTAAATVEEAVRERIAMPDLEVEGGWKVVPAERLHVTLRFLGETPVESTARLEGALREATAGVAAFPVRLSQWTLLPGIRAPRVLTLCVSDPTCSLLSLAEALEARARALGFPKEDRPFLPHVTVARRRKGHSRGRGGHAQARRGDCCRRRPPPASGMETDKAFVADTVGRVVLMKSTLGPAKSGEGPSYAVVAEAVLGG